MGEPSEEQLDQIFRALADQTRRAILDRLANAPASISALAEPFDMSLPAVSKHVRVLERAGLVRREIEGRTHHCHLEAARVREAASWLSARRLFWETSLDSLAAHMKTLESSS